MTLPLRECIEVARDEGRDARLAAFEAVAPPSAVRAAWVLSAALALGREQLVRLVSDLWPDEVDAEEGVEELVSWPFVEWVSDSKLALSDSIVDAFRLEFLGDEPGKFRTAHERLVRLEEAQEFDDDPDETWYARGRIAYYLAGFNEDEAADQFATGFSTPPELERTDARMWLSWLALRQAPLMPAHARELAFFRGFRYYVTGQRELARQEFDLVTGSVQEDRYEALAAHLAGILRRKDAPEAGIALLRNSIALSDRLGLRENKIMAAQSLATALLMRGSDEDLVEAAAVARANLAEARELGDEYIERRSRTMAANAEWLQLTAVHRDVTAEAIEQSGRILGELREGAAAVAIDTENAALSANFASGVLLDLGEVGESLNVLEDFVQAVRERNARVPYAQAQRIEKALFQVTRAATEDDQLRARGSATLAAFKAFTDT